MCTKIKLATVSGVFYVMHRGALVLALARLGFALPRNDVEIDGFECEGKVSVFLVKLFILLK